MTRATLLGFSILVAGTASVSADGSEAHCSIGGSYFSVGAMIRSGTVAVECTDGNIWSPSTRNDSVCTQGGAVFQAGQTLSVNDGSGTVWTCAAGGAWLAG